MMLRISMLLSLWAVLCPLLVGVVASPVHAPAEPEERDLSNAERLKRGLPLARPRRMYNPSRTRREVSAVSPPVPLTYVLQAVVTTSRTKRRIQPVEEITFAQPQYLGYDPSTGFSFLTTNIADAVLVSGVPGTNQGTMQFIIGSQSRYACFRSTSADPDIRNSYAQIKASETIIDSDTYKCSIWTIPNVIQAVSGTALSATWSNTNYNPYTSSAFYLANVANNEVNVIFTGVTNIAFNQQGQASTTGQLYNFFPVTRPPVNVEQ